MVNSEANCTALAAAASPIDKHPCNPSTTFKEAVDFLHTAGPGSVYDLSSKQILRSLLAQFPTPKIAIRGATVFIKDGVLPKDAKAVHDVSYYALSRDQCLTTMDLATNHMDFYWFRFAQDPSTGSTEVRTNAVATTALTSAPSHLVITQQRDFVAMLRELRTETPGFTSDAQQWTAQLKAVRLRTGRVPLSQAERVRLTRFAAGTLSLYLRAQHDVPDEMDAGLIRWMFVSSVSGEVNRSELVKYAQGQVVIAFGKRTADEISDRELAVKQRAIYMALLDSALNFTAMLSTLDASSTVDDLELEISNRISVIEEIVGQMPENEEAAEAKEEVLRLTEEKAAVQAQVENLAQLFVCSKSVSGILVDLLQEAEKTVEETS